MLTSDLPILERKIGGTIYIVESAFSTTATESAVEKIRRIILNEAKKTDQK